MSIIYKFLKSTSGLIFTVFFLVFSSVIWVYPFVENISELLKSRSGFYTVAIGALIWMLGAPILLIKKVFKKKIKNFGWRLPENKKEAVILTLLSFFLTVPFLIYFSYQPSFQSFYQIGESSLLSFLIFNVLLASVYYLSEEFLFRGFLFFGLYKKIGKHSFWVVSVLFALLHFSKPGLEIPFAFFVGLMLCYLSYKTKSFLPAFVVHLLISIFLNYLIIFL